MQKSYLKTEETKASNNLRTTNDSSENEAAYFSLNSVTHQTQNMSSLLNNPLSSSYFDEIVNWFSLSSAHCNVDDFTIAKDIDHLTILDILPESSHDDSPCNNVDIETIRGRDNDKTKDNTTTNSAQASTKSLTGATIPIKPWWKWNYDDYLKWLKRGYSVFNSNHTTTLQLRNRKNSPRIDDTNTDPERLNTLTDTGNPNEAVVYEYKGFADNDYSIAEDKYKIDANWLNETSLSNIQNNVFDWIQRGGDIEIKWEVVMMNNTKVYSHIMKTFPSWYEKILFFAEKVNIWKNIYSNIRRKYIEKSAELLMKRKKVSNMIRLKKECENLKMIYSVVKGSHGNCLQEESKFIEGIERYSCGREIMERYNIISMNNIDKLFEEIASMWKTVWSKLTSVSNVNPEKNSAIINKINEYGSKNTKDKESYIDNILYVHINQADFSAINEKIKQVSVSGNPSNEVKMKRLHELILSAVNDELNMISNHLNQSKRLNLVLFVYNITKAAEAWKGYWHYNWTQTPLSFDGDFQKKIDKTILSFITSTTVQTFNFASISQLDDFIYFNYFQRQILECFKLEKTLASEIPSPEANEVAFCRKFIIDKLTKLNEGISYETFTAFESVPMTYQWYIDKITIFDLCGVETFPKNLLFFSLDMVEMNSRNSVPFLSFSKYPETHIKIIPTSLDIITSTFEILKMLSTFSIPSYTEIISSLFSWYNNYITLNKTIILDALGHIKQWTQNEISICHSNLWLVKYLIQTIHLNDKYKFFDQFTNNKFQGWYGVLIENWEHLLKVSKDKMSFLVKASCIDPCVKQFREINLFQYPITSGENMISWYATNLCMMIKAIYESIVHVYDEKFVKELLNKHVAMFYEKMRDGLALPQYSNIKDKWSQHQLKQFKLDLGFLFRNVNEGMEWIDAVEFKKGIKGIFDSFFPNDSIIN